MLQSVSPGLTSMVAIFGAGIFLSEDGAHHERDLLRVVVIPFERPLDRFDDMMIEIFRVGKLLPEPVDTFAGVRDDLVQVHAVGALLTLTVPTLMVSAASTYRTWAQ